MKKLSLLTLSLLIFLAGCESPETNIESPKDEFTFLSLSWGDDLETVQNSDIFRDADIESTKDDAVATRVTAKNIDFYGKKVDAGLMFGNDDYTKGLNQVIVLYKDEDEADILAEMTKIYGERQNYFLDKNGIENPIQPAGWYCDERVETVLNEAGKEAYLKKLEGKDDTMIDAYLRQPLVTIRFDEENNRIVFKGTDAAVVRSMNKE